MFLFVAPWLYVIHAALDGLSFMIADMLSVRIGNTLWRGHRLHALWGSAGNAKTNWIYVIIVGLFWAIIYYLVFRFLITKFNVATPGRESDGESVSVETKDSIGDRDESAECAWWQGEPGRCRCMYYKTSCCSQRCIESR